MLAKLTILRGKRQGECLELGSGEHQIGTGRAAEIQLRDKDVGFKHAKVVVEDGGVFLEDLKSKAGTLVNGKPIDTRVPIEGVARVQIGEVELELECVREGGSPAAPAAPAPAPEAAAAATPALAEAVEPAAAAAPAASAAPAATAELATDAAQLQAYVRDLERRLAEKSQEAEALHQALEAQGTGAGDAAFGYGDSVTEEQDAKILELQHMVDEREAQLVERAEEVRALERQLDQLQRQVSDSKEAAERQKDSMAGEVLRSHEKLESWRGEVDAAKAEVARFEEVNAELMLENEETKERLEALQYQLEQETAARATLVRERTQELQKEQQRLEESNAEMRTLVEAYEEKIDELDERVEELEGENEALERLVTELRAESDKAKGERDTMIKTLRQKVKALEQRTTELEGDRTRAQAAAARAAAGAEART